LGGVGTTAANTLGLPDDTGESTTTSAEGDTVGVTDDADGTTLAPETGDPSGPLDDTTGPPDGSTTGEPPPTTSGGEPLLTISDGPTYDFGNVPTGGQASHSFLVTNTGDGEATGLSGAVPAPFGFPGGFPGSGGDCGGSLGAGQSCMVEVAFTPTQLGVHAGTLAVSHDAGPDATRDVAGGGAGESDNLLGNPGGESGGTPPPSWTAVTGTWIAGVLLAETLPYAGVGYLYADAGPNNTDYVLRQDVDVSQWATTLDQGVLHVSFSGRARAYWGGDDEHRIRVHYRDAGGATLQTWTTNYLSEASWQQYADARTAPSGTRTVRVELNCRKNSGPYCHAYFDALDLRASYP
jgi:hypothetical protein